MDQNQVAPRTESLAEKIRRWWEAIKNFLRNASRRIIDFFWRHENFFRGLHHAFNGLEMANLFISLDYLIRIGGSAKSTLLTIYSTTKNAIGNPTWWCRFDMPHPGTPYTHINVNPRLSGHADLHTALSGLDVEIVKIFGPILKFLSDIGPFLIAAKVAIDVGRLAWAGYKDYKNGSTRNTIKMILSILSSTVAGIGGFYLASALGTMVLPGLGTLLGALLIGILGGVAVGMTFDFVCDKFFDWINYDIQRLECSNCHGEFVNRIYEEGEQTMCNNCRLAQ